MKEILNSLREGLAGMDMWSILVLKSEQHAEKPVFVVSDKVRLKPVCSATEAS